MFKRSLPDREGVQWLLTGAAVGRTPLMEKYQGRIASASEPHGAPVRSTGMY